MRKQFVINCKKWCKLNIKLIYKKKKKTTFFLKKIGQFLKNYLLHRIKSTTQLAWTIIK